MANERQMGLDKLVARQNSDGSFGWFPGGTPNWYMTQYLIEGFGHLIKLGADDFSNNSTVNDMLVKAVQYCDVEIVRHYEEMKKYNPDLSKDNLSYIAIHYMYARSFFPTIPIPEATAKVQDYYLQQAKKYWLSKNLYAQGMIALVLHRNNQFDKTKELIASFKERSLNNEELGMYWKGDGGWNWYELPIETHALMIEVFDEAAQDANAVDDLKVWLLKNKQTTNWKTTKATAAAVYALLRFGDNWLKVNTPVSVTVNNEKLDNEMKNSEAGTLYYKKQWDGAVVNNNFATVTVNNPNTTVAWGAAYWQYFEDLNKIKSFKETPLKIVKQLFKVVDTDTGEKLQEIAEDVALQVGDKLKVRIEIVVDRPMEYVHLKDMRASGFEPINVLSQFKWQAGLGYYESTRDIATNFFIDYLPKGTHVFEYPLRVQHRGKFSNGITTMQSMYAPEFTSHSEGITVRVQ